MNHSSVTVDFEFPKIYPITDVQLSGLSHTDQAKYLIDGGAKIIQFREKYAAPLDWIDDLHSAVQLCREKNVTSIINDRVDIAMSVGADGVHLGQNDLPPDAARRILGARPIIGYSSHTIEQIQAGVKLPIDYIAFGPVFTTSTKESPDSVVGLAMLCEARKIVKNIPLVAIGGINLSNALSVFDTGVDSIAVISDIVTDPTGITMQMSSFSKMFA